MFSFKKKEDDIIVSHSREFLDRVKAIEVPRPSVVGETVTMLENNRAKLETEIEDLTREITDKIERRRQLIVSLGAVTAAQTMLAADKSLTSDQRQMADREVVISLKDIRLDEP